ncbi:tyrosine-type recombinase/integrase [Streptomyces niveus]|uniref:tyrosine-type recombinase/integrase n=1 Tax=Streptomyces niveus TaxID=193462 RepID=UPI003652D2FE
MDPREKETPLAGYIEDRWIKKKKDPVTGKRERTARYGKGKRYKVARIPGVRDRSFDTLEDAKAWLRRSSTDQERGEFVDPRDGSITLAEYVERYWMPGVRGEAKTRKGIDERIRLHVIPHLGDVSLNKVSAAELRAYIVKLESSCSPQYARSILSTLSSVLETAVDDKRLARNPMRSKSVRWPKLPDERREAWPEVLARRVRDEISQRHRIAVILGLGCGLRQGEVFGLSMEDVDHARGVLHVRRQVQIVNGRKYFTLPKGGKTRVADMPRSVADELVKHARAYPGDKVELPWGGPESDRERKKFGLVLTTKYGNAIAANTWNTEIWKPALARAGVIPPRVKGAKPWQWQAAPKDGFHVLRHTYASLVLEAGESVVTLAKWLGHSTPSITLDHYAHFMPEAGRKGRRAIDSLLGERAEESAGPNSPDSPQARS